MKIADYLSQLKSLLPLGKAWTRSQGSWLERLLLVIADAVYRVDRAARTFLDEIDPRTTSLLIDDFEEMLGLPDPYITQNEIDQTLDQRRAAAEAKLTAQGGASRPFFIDAAKRFGYAGASVDLFRPATCDGTCDAALWSASDRWTWQLNVPDQSGGVFIATCESACDAPLAAWGDTAFELHINQIKPDETTVIFAYQ